MLKRIYEATGTRTQNELAEFLGVRQSTISDAQRRESLPPGWLLTIIEKTGHRPEWIRTGMGARFLVEADAPATNKTPRADEQATKNERALMRCLACRNGSAHQQINAVGKYAAAAAVLSKLLNGDATLNEVAAALADTDIMRAQLCCIFEGLEKLAADQRAAKLSALAEGLCFPRPDASPPAHPADHEEFCQQTTPETNPGGTEEMSALGCP